MADSDSDSPLGARAAAAAAPDEAAKAALRRRTVRSLSWSMFMQFFTSTMVRSTHDTRRGCPTEPRDLCGRSSKRR